MASGESNPDPPDKARPDGARSTGDAAAGYRYDFCNSQSPMSEEQLKASATVGDFYCFSYANKPANQHPIPGTIERSSDEIVRF